MFAEVANWANDAAAIEKSLRLVQALVQIAAGTALTPADAEPWSKARGEFALARRYLRLFKWIDCGQAAKREWNTPQDTFRRVIATSKWAALAVYFFMEALCITNAMQVTSFPVLTALQHHALQCWFIAICISLFQTSYDILLSPTAANVPSTQASQIQFLIDACDILIPGSAVGWINVDSVTVGVTSSISSVLAGWPLWKKVQAEAREKEVRRAVKERLQIKEGDKAMGKAKTKAKVNGKVVLDEKKGK